MPSLPVRRPVGVASGPVRQTADLDRLLVQPDRAVGAAHQRHREHERLDDEDGEPADAEPDGPADARAAGPKALADLLLPAVRRQRQAAR